MNSLLKFKFQYWFKCYHHWCMKISDHFFLNNFLTLRRKIVWIKLVFYLPLAIPSFFFYLTVFTSSLLYSFTVLFYYAYTSTVFHFFIFLNFFISNFIVTYFNTLEFYLAFFITLTPLLAKIKNMLCHIKHLYWKFFEIQIDLNFFLTPEWPLCTAFSILWCTVYTFRSFLCK